jgi:hypothetical protein
MRTSKNLRRRRRYYFVAAMCLAISMMAWAAPLVEASGWRYH